MIGLRMVSFSSMTSTSSSLVVFFRVTSSMWLVHLLECVDIDAAVILCGVAFFFVAAVVAFQHVSLFFEWMAAFCAEGVNGSKCFVFGGKLYAWFDLDDFGAEDVPGFEFGVGIFDVAE